MAHNKEVEEILIARRWFRQIFNDDYTLNEKATLEYLKKLYIDHGDRILSLSEERQKQIEDDKIPEAIDSSYEYLLDRINNRIVFQPKSGKVKELLESYKSLVSEMADYYYGKARVQTSGMHPNRKSIGYNQNKASRGIMVEISMLDPFILKALENIDVFISTGRYLEYTESGMECLGKIEFFKHKFKVLEDQIRRNRYNYINHLLSYLNRRDYGGSSTAYDVSLNKKCWKKKRNEACNAIFCFCGELLELLRIMPYEETTYSSEEIGKDYDYAIDNIMFGPYYYSYIGIDQIRRIEAENKDYRSRKKAYQKKIINEKKDWKQ